MVQSAVMAISLLLLSYIFCIYEMLHPSSEVIPLGGQAIAIVVFLYFEIIIIPIYTACLIILKHIRRNRIKIETNKSIVIFTILYELVWFANFFIPASCLNSSFWLIPIIDCLIVVFGIIALNSILVTFKPLHKSSE